MNMAEVFDNNEDVGAGVSEDLAMAHIF